MRNQKAISAKIDANTLEKLDTECVIQRRKRNTVLNEALRLWLALQENRQRTGLVRTDYHRDRMTEEWICDWMPWLRKW